jgi:nitric oxide reductase subunit B
MVFFNLFPLGILQLGDSVANGYWHARSIEFFRTHALLEWLRLPGDALFIAGVVPVVYLTGKAVLRRRPMPEPEPAGVESPESPLFREVVPGSVEGGEAMPAEGRS